MPVPSLLPSLHPRRGPLLRPLRYEPEYGTEVRHRNRQIYRQHLSGCSPHELAERFHLSEQSIRRVIRQERGR